MTTNDTPTSAVRQPRDAITLFTSLDGKPINKFAQRRADGSVEKGYIPHKQNYHAETRAVPDPASFAELLREVGERPDQSIGVFVFADHPPRWQSWSKGRLARALGCPEDDRAKLTGWHEFGDGPVAARLSENLLRSSWGLLDRDDADAMPDELRDLTFDEWCEAVNLLIPGFAACGKVVLPSTSTRVLVDGVPLTSISCHVYTQMADVDCFAEPWHDAYERAAVTSYQRAPWEEPLLLAFGKPRVCHTTGRLLGKQLWSIYDQSTWAVNRLVFDGQPTSYSADLSVAPPVVRIAGAGRLDWSKVKPISRAEQKEIDAAVREITGYTRSRERTYSIGRSGKQVVSGVTYNIPVLTPSFEVKTDAGWTTIGAWHETGETHARAQNPFCEGATSSSSFLGRHRDGTPFLFITSLGEKYTLNRDQLEKRMWQLILDWLHEDYQPTHASLRDGEIISAALERRMTMRDVHMDDVIVDRLAMASDAPCDAKGRVKRLALPTEFRKWLGAAWGRLLRDLPPDDNEDLKQQVGALLKHLTANEAVTPMWGKRTLGTWVHWVASLNLKKWRRFGSHDAMGMIDDEGFRVAILQSLAGQLSRQAHAEIAAMTPETFTKRCRRAGILDSRSNIIVGEDGRLKRWTILLAEFVASLDLATDHGDPLAQKLKEHMEEHEEEISKSAGKGFFGGKMH